MTAPLVDRVRYRLASAATDSGRPALDLTSAARLESQLVLDETALAELSAEISAEVRGAGPLEELLGLADVTDVLVNGPDQVFIDRGRGLERCGVGFAHDAAIRSIAVRLAGQAGRRLDDATPFVDAVLPDGTRLHAILPPLVAHPTLSLRVLTRRRFTLPDLVFADAVSAPVAELLRTIVTARLTVLISGGTGTGKTTLLAALLATVDPGQRIITVEDAPELGIEHPHVVGLTARAVNVERAGGVDLAELVRQALRMRVDRLVVGEFRGAEITELLTALNTGHAGGAATVHANSTRDVPARLTALAALGGMSAPVLTAQVRSAIDVLVHVERDRAGRRRVSEIATWVDSGLGLEPQSVWSIRAGPGPGAGRLARLISQSGYPVPGLIDASSVPRHRSEP